MKTRRTLSIGLGCAALVGLSWLTHALAAGVPPTPGSLYYTGEVTNVSGAPFTATSIDVQLRLFDRATHATGETMYCAIDAPGTPVSSGHFRVALDPPGNRTCVDAIHAHPSVWIEIQIEGETLAREPLGAVPYALEAARVSVGGVTLGGYCGRTSAVTGRITSGAEVGYAAARSLCAASCASPSAHMCSGDELVRSLQAGVDLGSTPGWYASGVAVGSVSGLPGVSTTATLANDCGGFTQDMRTDGTGLVRAGARFNTGPTRPGWVTCDTPTAIYCCD